MEEKEHPDVPDEGASGSVDRAKPRRKRRTEAASKPVQEEGKSPVEATPVEAQPEEPVVMERPEPEPKPEHYITQRWHDKNMFQCMRCPWSTLDETEMIKHIAKHFTAVRRENVSRTDTGLVTVSGNKIFREEIVEPDEE
jgi:hypothetical protein